MRWWGVKVIYSAGKKGLKSRSILPKKNSGKENSAFAITGKNFFL
jgi:hypothetical protein